MKTKILIISTILLFIALNCFSQTVNGNEDYRVSDKPFVIEYYYKIKWGYFDEFLKLYKKNHWPFIESALKDGAMLGVVVHRPQNHPGEQNRWDLRVTITYRNVLIAHGLDDFDIETETKLLFPDQEMFIIEEKRRFEILEEHMDVEIYEVSIDDW